VQTVGVGLWIGSWMVLVSAVVGGFIWDLFIRPQEEADLAARFGDEYREYCRSVRCWVPTIGRHMAG
jgi:protein-S-isoprenylcysteine O-methyltransferase Ste14